MAEVVGLVAAGGQFVQQSIKIIQLSKKIRDKYKDAPQEVQGWQHQIETLQKVVENVRQSPSLQVEDVSSTIEQCKSVSDSVLDIFDKIQFDGKDSFRHKTWRVAISFSKEEEIQALFSQLEQLKSTLDIQIVASILKGLKLSSEAGSDEDKCLRALFVTDPVSDRESLITAKGNRTPGTFEWIPRTEQYTDWNASSHAILWISGQPGKGKTVMSIFLSKLMEATKPNSTVIFFFCDNKVASRNSAVNVLRGLMSQLIQYHPHLITILFSTWNVQQENLFRTTSFETLWRIFVQMLETIQDQEIYCVLDAPDECDEESLKLLLCKIKTLFENLNTSKVSLKLIIASREDPKCISQTLAAFPRIILENLDKDIDLYVLEKVAYLCKTKNIEGTPLQRQIEDAFREGAQGTFLWVSYMAQGLENKSLSEIEFALTELPRGLYEIYERILAQIKVDKREKIAEMLMWILFAERPLNISELCDAIQIQTSQNLTREMICFDYISSCGNLLQLHEDDGHGETLAVYSPSTAPTHAEKLHSLCVTFLHQSVKDYLLRPNKKRQTVRISTDRLLEEHLCYELDDLDWSACLERNPLLRYAVDCWSFHMRQLYDDIKPILRQHRDFFGRRSITRNNWARHRDEIHWLDSYHGVTILHLACVEGLHSLAKTWLLTQNPISRLRNHWTIDQQFGTHHCTALHLAARSGSIETLGINARDRDGYTPLHQLATSLPRDMVFKAQLLLDFGADRSLRDKRGRSALDIAHESLKDAMPFLMINQIKTLIEILKDYTTVAVDVEVVDVRLGNDDRPYVDWNPEILEDQRCHIYDS
ncbi:hypothetical protein FLONG3_6312 [Fusarium longipes]|uniref:Uncharacterized protein n=1 Tax=Fusarium longipes TaxID=694270 RepID=A0A395SNE0_9HYPO|nr:hypothetical protein FLONG3_6312 [Fusarium longipes]